MTEIFADELNVKRVQTEKSGGSSEQVVLDTVITHELHLDWIAREIIRKVNELRKKAQLKVDERITLLVDGDGDIGETLETHRVHIETETLATAIEGRRGDALAQLEDTLGEHSIWLGVAR